MLLIGTEDFEPDLIGQVVLLCGSHRFCRPGLSDPRTSAIIKDEFNCLINTMHPDFNRIKRKAAEPFFFDPRIKAK